MIRAKNNNKSTSLQKQLYFWIWLIKIYFNSRFELAALQHFHELTLYLQDNWSPSTNDTITYCNHLSYLLKIAAIAVVNFNFSNPNSRQTTIRDNRLIEMNFGGINFSNHETKLICKRTSSNLSIIFPTKICLDNWSVQDMDTWWI